MIQLSPSGVKRSESFEVELALSLVQNDTEKRFEGIGALVIVYALAFVIFSPPANMPAIH